MKPQAKPQKSQPDTLGLPHKFTAITVIQTTYITNEAYELDIEGTTVVAVRKLTQSPDISAIVLSQAAQTLGQHLDTQRSKDYK